MCDKATVGLIFERFGQAVKHSYKLSKEQHKVLSLIGQCRNFNSQVFDFSISQFSMTHLRINACGHEVSVRSQGKYLSY